MIAGDLLVALEDRLELVLADDVVELVETLAGGALLDRVDDHVGRRRAVLQHDAAGGRQPRRLVGLERRRRIGLARQQPGERGGVDDRLGAAVAALRIHRMGGVAEQRHAAERPARDRVAVDHRVGEDRVGGADHGGGVEPVEAPVGIDRVEVLEPAGLVPVDRHRHLALDLRHPVDQLVAGGVDVVADRIDDQGRVAGADAGDALAREVGLMPRHPAPQVDAAIGERALVRIELRPHRRMDAVAGDQHIGLLGGERGAVRGGEARRHARLALLDAHAAMAGDEVVGAQPLAHGVEQHLVQVGAVDREMRPLVPGSQPPGLAVDQLAVAGEEGVVLRLAGDRRQRVLQAQRAELLDRVRPEIDADPERMDLGRRLEHPDAPGAAAGVDRERQRQAADAAADNDDVHRSSLAAPSAKIPAAV